MALITNEEKKNNTATTAPQQVEAPTTAPESKPSTSPAATTQAQNKTTYNNTMQALKATEYTAPTFSSDYDEQISDIYDKIVNREAFKYDYASDPMYGQYKENYTQLGQQAMRDTMGQAAALTGGYGSSYGQAVGQQQYDAYLQRLNDVLPELYGQAYDIYAAEGDELAQQLGLANVMRDTEYQHYRDDIADQQYQDAWNLQQAELRAQYGDFGGLQELYGADAAKKAEALFNLQTLAPYIESGLYLYPGMESLLAPLMGSAGISMSGLLGSGSNNNDVWGYGGEGWNPGYQLTVGDMKASDWKEMDKAMREVFGE